MQARSGDRAYRPGRQVRAASGCLPQRRRGPAALRHPSRPPRGDGLGGRGDSAPRGDPFAARGFDGILVPGGFGVRGIEGKIMAVEYAREGQVPFLGICLGLQVAVVEFARHMSGLIRANSSEFDLDTPLSGHRPAAGTEGCRGQRGHDATGGLSHKARAGHEGVRRVREEVIYERHRHRYEVNNVFRRRLVEAGLVVSGVTPDERLVEIIELADHPWFVASQFHPSSRAGRHGRSRCSVTSSERPSPTASPGESRSASSETSETCSGRGGRLSGLHRRGIVSLRSSPHWRRFPARRHESGRWPTASSPTSRLWGSRCVRTTPHSARRGMRESVVPGLRGQATRPPSCSVPISTPWFPPRYRARSPRRRLLQCEGHHPGSRQQGRGGRAAGGHRAPDGLGGALPDLRSWSSPWPKR